MLGNEANGSCTGTPLLDDEDDAAARVGAWADRMKAKRQATKARIAADQAAAAGHRPDEPTYWTTDALFEESRRVEQERATSGADPAVVAELLAVLDLRDGADGDALNAAYRRLAKAHHPDRWATADEGTQRFHAERMLEINRAYKHLRTAGRS